MRHSTSALGSNGDLSFSSAMSALGTTTVVRRELIGQFVGRNS